MNHLPVWDDDGKQMTCEEFQEQLPELFESGKDLTSHPHLQTCENCAALVRDLQYIADAAKLLLPIQEPGPGVWRSIQSALEKAPEQEPASKRGGPRRAI